MRAMFGLVSLLVVMAIIVFLFSVYSVPVAKTGKKAQIEVRQMSGHDEDGTPVGQTITLDGELRNNTLKDLVVTSLVPGGAMERFYGFKVGDKILAIGGTDFATLSAGNDVELAKSLLSQEGYQKKAPVTVIRNGQRLELPGTAVPFPPSAQPASSSNPPSDSSSHSIADQLKAIGAGQ